jgi:hypothetical protein
VKLAEPALPGRSAVRGPGSGRGRGGRRRSRSGAAAPARDRRARRPRPAAGADAACARRTRRRARPCPGRRGGRAAGRWRRCSASRCCRCRCWSSSLGLFAPASETWSHVASTVLSDYIINSAAPGGRRGACAAVIGVSTAWLVTAYDFPGRRFFEWALILPLAVPAYIAAYTYAGMFDVTGPLQRWCARPDAVAGRRVPVPGRHEHRHGHADLRLRPVPVRLPGDARVLRAAVGDAAGGGAHAGHGARRARSCGWRCRWRGRPWRPASGWWPWRC